MYIRHKTELVKIKLKSGTIEVEKSLHTEMNSTAKIKIPSGYRLLTLAEFIEIWNYHKEELNYGDGEMPDEVVQQPIIENEKKYPYWNVWFRSRDCGQECKSAIVLLYTSMGVGSVLYDDDRGLYDDDRVRGVRFVKK